MFNIFAIVLKEEKEDLNTGVTDSIVVWETTHGWWMLLMKSCRSFQGVGSNRVDHFGEGDVL